MLIINKKGNKLIREEATSALDGFHVYTVSSLNWNLETLVFTEGGN